MSNTLKTVGIAVASAVVVCAFGFWLVGSNQSAGDTNEDANLGGANRYPHGYVDTRDGYYVDGIPVITGSGKQTAAGINTGSCNLAALASEYPTIAVASSTFILTCSAPGVVAGDKVLMNRGLFPIGSGTTTWAGFGGSFTGAMGFTFRSASSTAADTISVEMLNQTGAATSSFIQATSSWQYFFWH